MIIDRDLTPYVVFSGESVLTALRKIDANRARLVFCVSERGHLEAALSDGDFRRWVTTVDPVDLTVPVSAVANRSVVSARVDADPGQIERLLEPGRIGLVPLVDDAGHLVAIADSRTSELRIGRHLVGPDQPTLLIAEIGINHNGSPDLARHLVDLAVDAGADVVKFQLRDMQALYRGAGDSAGEDLGPQYTMDLLNRFSLDRDRLFEVFDHCARRDIDVMCTAWDEPSAAALVEYGVPALKIASADLTNHSLLTAAAAGGRALVVSTGMSTEGEIRESVALLRGVGAPFAMLHCQSTYPAPFKDVNLRYLTRLAELTGAPVGYSGHERGFHVPIAAVAMGARIIEKHFTLDRAMEGNDHKVSLLPEEFARMVTRIREVEQALGSDAPREVSTGEMMNRINLAKSLVAARRIGAGTVLTRDDVEIKSPGRGLQPNRLPALLGRTLAREVDAGDFFYASDLSDATPRTREFSFRRPWGLPVRYHDWRALVAGSKPDFLEFHFSYKDLDLDPAGFFADLAQVPGAVDGRLPFGYTTHSPDLFAGDFLLNLAAEDAEHWERSIRELQRVVDTTRSMRHWFRDEQDPVVIASLGGFTKDAHLPAQDLPRMYDRVAAGLARLDTTGVRFTAQTLPPFPWYLGGQLFCNLFVGAQDTAQFAEANGVRLTFDVSHSKLSANFVGQPFSEMTELLAPHTDHLHLVDARGVDGEGVQIGDGEIDWPVLARQLDRFAPQAAFIPEIWQGHVDDGAGFWTALERLEQWF